jgi:outer membrane protein OmpA-like peptidoglycan-associated protein
MNQRLPLARAATATTTGAALLLLAPCVYAAEYNTNGQARVSAEAGDFSLKVEPGVAIPLTSPQSEIFDIGGSETIKALWALTPYLDIGPSATFVSLGAEQAGEPGNAWAFGGGLQLKRPHDAPDDDAVFAISPWLDVDALYVRTGDLNRAGFAAAVGLAVPVNDSRSFWIGPFARYFQILQGDRATFDNDDAKILSLGVSLEWGSGARRQAQVVVPEQFRPVSDTPPVFACPDRDTDGILDNVDQCPDVAGPIENRGCRTYQKIIVSKEKLELKERLYFAWNQATLQEVSYPVLDEVVLALQENKNFRVQVEGHTSSEGGNDHNQTLSEQRAAAVLDYLVAHGIDKSRLVSKGFASSVPTDTNTTAEGRDNNRRVEFVVNFIILDEGTK